VIDAIAAMHARGVTEVSTSDLLAEVKAQGRDARRESLRPLLSELSGAARGGRRVAGAELIRLRTDCYRITGESGPLAAPRPAAERGITLDRALRSWMEDRAAAGTREFGLADATAAVEKYGMVTSRATVKGVLASHFMFTGRRADAGRRAVGDATPTVKRIAHGRYKFVGQPRQERAGSPPHVTALGKHILEVLTRYQADGKNEVTAREIADRLKVPASLQAIVRQMHRLHLSGAATVRFMGNNRCRTYVFTVPQDQEYEESPKYTRTGDRKRIPQQTTPSPSAA